MVGVAGRVDFGALCCGVKCYNGGSESRKSNEDKYSKVAMDRTPRKGRIVLVGWGIWA